MRRILAATVAVAGLMLAGGAATALATGAIATQHPANPATHSTAPAPVHAAAPTPSASASESSIAPAQSASGELPVTVRNGIMFGTPGIHQYGADTDAAAIDYPANYDETQVADAKTWVQTQTLTAQCMADKGFDYRFMLPWERDRNDRGNWWPTTVAEDQQDAAALALDGQPGVGGEYRWEDAGCWGWAVHVMGNDDAN